MKTCRAGFFQINSINKILKGNRCPLHACLLVIHIVENVFSLYSRMYMVPTRLFKDICFVLGVGGGVLEGV